MSENGIFPSSSHSTVKSIYCSSAITLAWNVSKYSLSDHKPSYHLHISVTKIAHVRDRLQSISKCTMQRSSKTGDSGFPIAIPNFCLRKFLSNLEPIATTHKLIREINVSRGIGTEFMLFCICVSMKFIFFHRNIR